MQRERLRLCADLTSASELPKCNYKWLILSLPLADTVGKMFYVYTIKKWEWGN